MIRYACALLCAVPATAQAPAQPSAQPEMKTAVLAPGVAVVSYGNQGNVGVSYGPDGVVLIDAMYVNASAKLRAAIRALSAAPVRMVVNTHWHHDHAQGNETFAGSGATVVAHENVRRRMGARQYMTGLDRDVPPSPVQALPRVTYATQMTLHVNGDTLRLLHLPAAHTDGDTIVHWERANVLMMGDLFNRMTLPFIGLNEGGSIDGYIAAVARGVEIANADTRVVPGHGAVGTRADLQAFHTMLTDIRAQVAAGIAAGRSLDEIVRARPTARYGMTNAFIKPGLFVEIVYRSLRKEPFGRTAAAPSAGLNHDVRQKD